MIKLWQKLKSWLKGWLKGWRRRPFKTVYVAETTPSQLKPKTLYVVTEDDEPWHAEMICPCGCGKTLHMNLLLDERPVWQITEHNDGTSSLHPSVWRKTGCRSHFWFRKGQVVWCHDQNESL